MKTYDTKEGIERYLLEGGLAGLALLAKDRHEAGYKRRERLNEWIVAYHFYFDSCGNMGRLMEGIPSYVKGDYLPAVITKEQASQICEWRAEIGRDLIPPVGETCVRCLLGWNLDNAHDTVCEGVRDTTDLIWMHQECSALRLVDLYRDEFSKLFKDAGVEVSLRTIPNQYSKSRFWGPWFIADTAHGPVRIGWRKRVINIDWSLSSLKISGARVVIKESTTHGDKFTHAWGYPEALKCLRRLFGVEEK